MQPLEIMVHIDFFLPEIKHTQKMNIVLTTDAGDED